MGAYNDRGNTTEAAIIADLSDKAAQRTGAVTGHENTFVTLLGRDDRISINHFETDLPNPIRERGTFVAHTAESFIDLAGEFNSTTAVVYHDLPRRRFTSVLNHRGWRDHSVEFSPSFTEVYKAWIGHNNEWLSQSDFAEFLEERSADLLEPEPADLIEISRTFQAKRNVDFESGTRLQSGDVSFTYTEKTQASGGAKGTVKIPERFLLALSIFEGEDPVRAVAALRYRIGPNGLSLGYRLIAIEESVRAALTVQSDRIKAGLEADTHVFGTAPNPVQPLD